MLQTACAVSDVFCLAQPAAHQCSRAWYVFQSTTLSSRLPVCSMFLIRGTSSRNVAGCSRPYREGRPMGLFIAVASFENGSWPPGM